MSAQLAYFIGGMLSGICLTVWLSWAAIHFYKTEIQT